MINAAITAATMNIIINTRDIHVNGFLLIDTWNDQYINDSIIKPIHPITPTTKPIHPKILANALSLSKPFKEKPNNTPKRIPMNAHNDEITPNQIDFCLLVGSFLICWAFKKLLFHLNFTKRKLVKKMS